MTDITNQDRRQLREDAKAVINKTAMRSSAAVSIARYILATVDAPEPTLAEEILDAAARIRDAVNPGDRDVSWADMESCADRAAQMEHDLTEARAEVGRLDAVAEDYGRRATAALTERDEARAEVKMERDLGDAIAHERDDARAKVDRLEAAREIHAHMYREARDEVDQARSELAEVTNARDSLREDYDHARAEVERLTAERLDRNSEMRMLTGERNEALIEVERLTAVNERLRKTDNYREFREQFLTVQKGAESNAETPDPADVPPGEAWIVEVDGERRTAVKDKEDYFQWNTVTAGGWLSTVGNADVILIARLVPAPRVIANPDDLDRLAVKSVVLDGVKRSCHKASDESWRRCDGMMLGSSKCLSNGSVTVLWEPGA